MMAHWHRGAIKGWEIYLAPGTAWMLHVEHGRLVQFVPVKGYRPPTTTVSRPKSKRKR
jgi:hypothetical protein